MRVDRYFYMYTFKGATQCNTIIIPVRMSLIPAYHRAEKCQSAKPVLGATLQTAKSRTMAAVTQATTAIISVPNLSYVQVVSKLLAIV